MGKYMDVSVFFSGCKDRNFHKQNKYIVEENN